MSTPFWLDAVKNATGRMTPITNSPRARSGAFKTAAAPAQTMLSSA